MKKLISIVSAVAMMVSMAFTVSANTEGCPVSDVQIKYNASASTSESAVVEVYATRVDMCGAFSMNIQLVDENDANVTNDYVQSLTSQFNLTNLDKDQIVLDTARGAISITGPSSNDDLGFPASGPVVTVTLTLKKAIDKTLDFKVVSAGFLNGDSYDEFTEEDITYTTVPIPGANVGPTLETVTATPFTYNEEEYLEGEGKDKEFVKDDSEDVDVYVAEYAFKSGQTKFFWSATIDSKTKKTADKAIPNVDGQAKLGIIIPASVGATAVALNVQ